MSHEFISDSVIHNSNLVAFNLEDIQLQVENNEVADITVNLDYIDGLNPSEFKNVVPIVNKIEDYLTNYPNNPNDSFEVINRNLTKELLTDCNLGLSEVLDSLSVNLEVAPAIIPFQFNSTITRTPNGDINDIVSFQLEDVTSPIDGGIVADITINLDYVDGIDPSNLKDVIPLSNFIEDYLLNYSNPDDSLEVVNNNLGDALLTDYNLGASEVLDSLAISLTAAPGAIPFQFSNTLTLTPIETTSFGESEFTTVLRS